MSSVSDTAGGKTRSFSSLAAAFGFGLSGAAFTLGSLLLARALPVEAYGRLTLGIALFNIFGLLTPLGVDQLFLRRPVHPGGRLLSFLLLSGAGVGGLLFLIVKNAGGLLPAEALLTALAVAAGGIVATASVGLRVAGRPQSSMVLAISASFVLLCAGTIAVAFAIRNPVPPLAIFAGGNVFFAAIGWFMLGRAHIVPAARRERIAWHEAASMLGLVALGTLSLQIERIIIPIPLGLDDLAAFGVLAAVAIFPFRLLTAGVGFSLPPKLSATPSAGERRRAVLGELRLLLLLCLPVNALLVVAAPWLATTVTGGLYTLDRMLILAACVNGMGKVAMAFPRAILTACGTPGDLVLLNGWGALWLVLTICGALVGARYGLSGLLWGASISSAIATFFSSHLAWSRIGKD